jgi:ParB-like chromosome segregation protein Spo0J
VREIIRFFGATLEGRERQKMKIETLQIKDLTADPQNARQHDEKNLKAIQGSLNQFGQRKPIVITEAGVIVAGNGTVEAAKRLGWTKIDAVKVPGDWTPDQIKAFALADNRTAELANWDKEVLATQLLDLEEAGFEIADFGFLQQQDSEQKELDTDSISYEDKFEVVIECKDEFEQQDFLERFTNEGLKVRAIIV